MSDADLSSAAAAKPGDYVVVARRYRPQTFSELIGQEHVDRALTGAITSSRVGHAYLFTGARGVGKTSAARILAKALNCVDGPAPSPCNACEICHSVSDGSDVDVLEIDGASNRGIDEIRQLRQNVAVRPSRARFKIYIIDEVHMLTKEAFNALLKTLEEPPEHVKFIFATTEPNKIPVTILSRCQRYDFAGIETAAIQQRLAEIAEAEGVIADDDALQLLAMRAAGSMRDSQSLLEQLLSTGKKQLTVGDVTELLGIAPAARLSRLVEPLVNRDAAAALAELDAAIVEGAEPGQLIDQLLGYFRDVMTQTVGCAEEQLLYALPGQRQEVRQVADALGVQTVLAIVQILDQAAARLRLSTQTRTLAEMAVVRITQLGQLDELADLVAQLRAGGNPSPTAAAPAVKKNKTLRIDRPPQQASQTTQAEGAAPEANDVEDAPSEPLAPSLPAAPEDAGLAASTPPVAEPDAPATPAICLQPDAVDAIWQQALGELAGMLQGHAASATRVSVDSQGRLVASFPASHKLSRDACERPANRSRIERAIADICGGPAPLVFATHDEPATQQSPAPARTTRRQQQASAAAEPFIQKAMELFDADESRLKYVPPADDA